jgi:hypothetical protein
MWQSAVEVLRGVRLVRGFPSERVLGASMSEDCRLAIHLGAAVSIIQLGVSEKPEHTKSTKRGSLMVPGSSDLTNT